MQAGEGNKRNQDRAANRDLEILEHKIKAGTRNEGIVFIRDGFPGGKREEGSHFMATLRVPAVLVEPSACR